MLLYNPVPASFLSYSFSSQQQIFFEYFKGIIVLDSERREIQRSRSGGSFSYQFII